MSDIMVAMDKLDSRTLVGVIYTYWPSQFDDLDKQGIWDRGVTSVKKLGKVAQDLGIDYCLEVVNRFETSVLNTCEEALQYVKDVDCGSVKILLDTFHMNIEEDNIRMLFGWLVIYWDMCMWAKQQKAAGPRRTAMERDWESFARYQLYKRCCDGTFRYDGRRSRGRHQGLA